MTVIHDPRCLYPDQDGRRLTWRPGELVPTMTRRVCPFCGIPQRPVYPRCRAVLVDGVRCRLPVTADGRCRVHVERLS